MSRDSCWRVCSRGWYSCHWSHSQPRKSRNPCCWFSVVALVSLLSLCWMYVCLVTFNDREDVNWKGFSILKQWVNWFMVVIIVYAVITSYCVLLLVFALFQVALREPLNLHWLHKILLFCGVLLVTFGVAGISLQWKKEWPTVPLSLQATAPFLQFGAVGALTLLSPFVFRGFHMAKDRFSKFLIAAVFLVVSAAIFLCPLAVQSPCLLGQQENLPEKPELYGHRGAPMLAPENTMMSFKRSVACGVAAFETDVQVSKDRIPFLMHDNSSGFLRRTTNVKKTFPHTDFSHGSELTWQELQRLNAGDWFIKTDPFHSVSQLSEEEKETARNQSIPTLLQLLLLAKQHDVSVIFDLYGSDPENDTVDTVGAILASGIEPSKVLWLPPTQRDYVNVTAPGFTHIYDNEDDMSERGGNRLNLKYSKLPTSKIRELRSRNISVNLWVVNERWLFSLLWCAGASSVTTNSCHLLQKMDRPDWFMSRLTYLMIWVAVDLASVLVMTALYVHQRRKHRCCHRRGKKGNHSSASAWNEKELSPFLSTQ